MCYNCGCNLKDDPMGKKRVTEGGASLTETDLIKMSQQWGLTLEETKENIYKLLKKELHKEQ